MIEPRPLSAEWLAYVKELDGSTILDVDVGPCLAEALIAAEKYWREAAMKAGDAAMATAHGCVFCNQGGYRGNHFDNCPWLLAQEPASVVAE